MGHIVMLLCCLFVVQRLSPLIPEDRSESDKRLAAAAAVAELEPNYVARQRRHN